jgi:phosphatidylglycerol:prolipoprotein diacylglycerol transferase
MPTLRTLDVLSPSLALGIFLTRIGCFFNGCCYGRPTDLPWGVVFPRNCPAGEFQRMHPEGIVPIHPTQLYSALYGAGIFALLLVCERHFKRFDGFTFFLLFFLISIARFFVQFLRQYYDETGQFLGLTHAHYVSIAFVAVSGISLILLSRRSGNPDLNLKEAEIE